MRGFWRPRCLGRGEFDRGGGRVREAGRSLPDVEFGDAGEGDGE